MNDFANLLIRSTQVAGTLLHVAMLLQAEPKQVYEWMAGIERPSDQRIEELTQRLQAVARSSNIRSTSASTDSTTLRRRWCDLAAAR